jgi:hypothetical protein
MQADLVEASAGQPIDPVALLANVTIWDCRTSGGQAAIVIGGLRSLAGWNLCPKSVPSVPL